MSYKFNVSLTVALLGLSLYVCGLGLGPMLSAPLSEVGAWFTQFAKSYRLMKTLGVWAKDCLSREFANLPSFYLGCSRGKQHTNIVDMPCIRWNFRWACLGCIRRVLCRFVGIEDIRIGSVSAGDCNIHGPSTRYVNPRILHFDKAI